MFSNRFKLTCDIKRRSQTVTRGVETETESTLFSGVKCYLAKPDFSVFASSVDRSENGKSKIVVPLLVTGVEPGDVVEVSDGRAFMVEGVKRNDVFAEGNVELHSVLR